MMSRHLRDGELRAMHDLQLGWMRSMAVRLHLRQCTGCQARFSAIASGAVETADLLGYLDPQVGTTDAWQRVSVRAGSHGPSASPRRAALISSLATASAFLLLLLLAWSQNALRVGRQHIEDQCCEDVNGDGAPEEGVVRLQHPKNQRRLEVLYSDVDRTGSLSDGDVIFWVGNHSEN